MEGREEEGVEPRLDNTGSQNQNRRLMRMTRKKKHTIVHAHTVSIKEEEARQGEEHFRDAVGCMYIFTGQFSLVFVALFVPLS